MGTLLAIGLGNALVAALLAPLAAIVARATRRPAWAHGAWLLVLLKLVTPTFATVPVAWPTAPRPTAAVAASEAVGPVEPDPDRFEMAPEPTSPAPLPGPVAEEVTTPARPTSPANPPALPPRTAWPAIDPQAALGTAWLLGILAWSALACWRIGRFRRALREAMPAPSDLVRRVEALASRIGLRSAPAVVLMPGPVAPMIWALFGRPRLIVPEDLWARLDDGQRDALLVHELAHLRRRDHWVRGLELVATAIYGWHPALWWARRGLRQAEEQCCDAWVVWALPDAARSYATALVEAVDFLSEARPNMPIGAIGMGQARNLSRRIIMIMRVQPPRRLSMAGALVVLALAALLLPWRPTWARLPMPVQDQPRDRGVTSTAAERDLPRAGATPARAGVPDEATTPAREEIAALDTDLERAIEALARAEVKLEQKKALLDKAEAERVLAQADLARLRRLEERGKGFVSVDELEKAAAGMGVADAEVNLKKAELREGELLVSQARTHLEQHKQSRERAGAPTRARAADRDAVNDLKQIGLAIHNYFSANQDHLPPPYLADKDGHPLLSWRVAILPWLGEEELYKRFHLDEPWDSPHNRKLLKEMPPAYRSPAGRWATEIVGATHYRVIVGPETIWPDPRNFARAAHTGAAAGPEKNGEKGLVEASGGGSRAVAPSGPIGFAAITDGLSNTIMVVEAAEAAPWTKPEDLWLPAFDPAAGGAPILPEIAGPGADGFLAVYGDGAVLNVKTSIPTVTLRALLTRAGGEVIDGTLRGTSTNLRDDRDGAGTPRGRAETPADLRRRIDALEEKLNRLLEAQGGVRH